MVAVFGHDIVSTTSTIKYIGHFSIGGCYRRVSNLRVHDVLVSHTSTGNNVGGLSSAKAKMEGRGSKRNMYVSDTIGYLLKLSRHYHQSIAYSIPRKKHVEGAVLPTEIRGVQP